MRRIQDFRTDSPPELKRQLRQLEDNAAAMGDDIKSSLLPVLVSRGTKSDAVALAPGQFVHVDTAAADVGVLLDAPTPKLAGKFAAIIKPDAANAINVTSQSGQISLTATLSITGPGATLLFCDGQDYWTI